MRRTAIVRLSLAAFLAAAACAGLSEGLGEVGKALEGVLPEDSAEGKIVRGLGQLRKSFQELDPSEEHFIGRSVAAQIAAMPEYRPVGEGPLVDYINRIGQAIAAVSDEVRGTFIGYRLAVLDTEEVNAFATPGGTIFLSKGLIRLAQNEDDLAGVIAHEIAHVTLRHGLAAIKQANMLAAFQYLGAGAAQATLSDKDLQQVTGVFGDSIQDIITTLVKNGYSRDAEYEADELGARIAAAAGYDPAGMGRVLFRMGRHAGKGGFYSTHPAPAERIARLQAAPAAASDPEGAKVRAARFTAAIGG